jgi:hypothetical protein
MLNPIEPPRCVTRMPAGASGAAREGLLISIDSSNFFADLRCPFSMVYLLVFFDFPFFAFFS